MGSTASITVTSTSAQLPPPPKAEKVPLPISSIKRVKKLVLKENTTTTPALIGADEAASHIDAMTMQAPNAEMKKDSSDEEPDGDDTVLDYGGDESLNTL